MNKNIAFPIVVFAGICLFSQISYAESPTRGALRQERREVMQEKKEQVKEKTQNIIEQAKNIIKEKIKKQIKGKLLEINGNTLKVQKEQTVYTVNTTEKTEFKRKFGAASTLSEFSPNDQLLIIGNRKKDSDGSLSSNEIDATYIRNMSIQRRFAVFSGEVLTKSSNSFTLKTIGRGTQTVYVSPNTEYKLKNSKISFSDLYVGDKVVVKGELWDRTNEKIDAKSIIKLNIQKLRVTPSPTVTPIAQ